MIVTVGSRAIGSMIDVEVINGDIADAWIFDGPRLSQEEFERLLNNVYDVMSVFNKVEKANG